MWPASSGLALSLLSDLERFRGEMDSLFGVTSGRTSAREALFPPLAVVEGGEDFRIQAFAPGFTTSDFDITIQNTILTLRGTRKPAWAGEDGNGRPNGTLHRNERLNGSFTRVLTLPDSVDPAQVHATYTNGVLTVFIGKRTEMRPKKIEIKAQ